jgi:putative methyltransferase (TIGR04325 family)
MRMDLKLVPIALFVYNRPWHTKQVLDALASNSEAKNSILYIYCDGAKEGAREEVLNKINKTRLLAKNEKRFKEVILKEQAKNKGLANSIIDGVTEVISKHGRVIVLEDDILVSKGFLKYMNDALDLYFNEDKVGCIHAWNYHLDTSNYKESTFFLKGADCWGWATWKRAWDKFNPDGSELLRNVVSKRLEYDFDRKGTHGFVAMLKAQIEGKNDSWAIRWYASLFLAGQYCLQPTKAIVKNIGLDNSGIHCGVSYLQQETVDFIEVRKIKIQESDWFFKVYAKLLKGDNKISGSKWQIAKRILKLLIPPIFYKFVKPAVKLQSVQESKNGFYGDFKTWKEAEAVSKGYDLDKVIDKVKNATLKVKRGEIPYTRDSVEFSKIQYSWPLLSGLLWVANTNSNKLNVIDFGGSFGTTYFQNRKFLEKLGSLNWNIVEQEKYIKVGKECFEDNIIKFYPSIEDCMQSNQPDVMLLSSVLQYMQDPYVFLKYLLSAKIDVVIIDCTLISENDIVTIHKVPEGIFGGEFISRFLSKQKLMNCFIENGYALIEEFDAYVGSSILINDKAIGYSKGFIFKFKI